MGIVILKRTETSVQKANLPGMMDPGQGWENTLILDSQEWIKKFLNREKLGKINRKKKM